jgi:hypothetical protein
MRHAEEFELMMGGAVNEMATGSKYRKLRQNCIHLIVSLSLFLVTDFLVSFHERWSIATSHGFETN